MINLMTLLSTYPIWTVILITTASIIIILKLISGVKKLWAMRTQFHDNAVQEGERLMHEQDAQEHAAEEEESRIQQLEDTCKSLTGIIEQQQKLLTLLTESDKLNTKAWIKEQHDKWVPLGFIDSQSLDLICARYAIYELEGGNGWAKKMVDEIKALPVTIGA